jgi:ribosomal-protein-alanine N-acetyltransferase
MSIPVIESERLILRGLIASDAAEVQRLAGAFEVADTTQNIPHPYENGLAEEWIKRLGTVFHDGEGVTFAIVLKSNMRLVGGISLMSIEKDHQAELGYWIGVPFWGEGICTEAGLLVADYAFTVLGLARLHARHMSRNQPSGRVLRKIGFSHEGSLRAHVKKWGKFEDVETYGLMCSGQPAEGIKGSLVVQNVIQAEECNGLGSAYPHVVTRLFEDGVMTQLALLGFTQKQVAEIFSFSGSLIIETREACLANRGVSVYCQLHEMNHQYLELEMRLHYWPNGETVASAQVKLLIKASDETVSTVLANANSIKTSAADGVGDRDKEHDHESELVRESILLRHFTARHRGQAGHVNIQHFAQSATDACRNVASLLGVASTENMVVQREKVRFIAELHPGDTAFVRCDIEKVDRDRWVISGEMVRVQDNKLICQFQREIELELDEVEVERVRVSHLADNLNMDLRDIPIGDVVWGPIESYRGTVEPMEVDVFSNLSTRALWDKMTRGLWAVQNGLGANRDVMIKHSIAGGAAMFQLKFHRAARLGTPIVIQSCMRGHSESSLIMQHAVTDARDHSILIEASYVLTFFDRNTGRRIPMPSFIMALIGK